MTGSIWITDGFRDTSSKIAKYDKWYTCRRVWFGFRSTILQPSVRQSPSPSEQQKEVSWFFFSFWLYMETKCYTIILNPVSQSIWATKESIVKFFFLLLINRKQNVITIIPNEITNNIERTQKNFHTSKWVLIYSTLFQQVLFTVHYFTGLSSHHFSFFVLHQKNTEFTIMLNTHTKNPDLLLAEKSQ
jgi:hypothetical protein